MKDSNSAKGVSGKRPRSFQANGVPIVHFDFPDRDLGDAKAAARWAWVFLENLARGFCRIHCDHRLCSIRAGEREPLVDEPADARREAIRKKSHEGVWRKIQKDFHEALAYFPQSKQVTEGCPACAVAMAFSYFPILAFDSPVPPAAEVHMNAEDCYPDVVFGGGNIQKSMPCYTVVTDYGDSNIGREKIIRERALLRFDIDDLPLTNPEYAAKMKAVLMNGQAVVRAIDKTINPDDYIEIKPADSADVTMVEVRDRNQAEQRADSGAVESEKQSVTISRDGESWALTFEQKSIRMNDIKGLHYLEFLINHPEEEFLANDLRRYVNRTDGRRIITGQAIEEWTTETRSAPDIPIEMADRKAVDAYRDRARVLREEIASAKALGDRLRGEKAETELCQIEQELRRILGIGGRLRMDNDPVERARTSISNAIARALERIKKHNPDLWRYLYSTIKMGSSFSYNPK